ncbi:hypothetical protein [Bosea sp. BK604]|uniref:hypothetical protein n=1 Tax=Bosea sp. BK604 TaxID=2512180 RepID=UPI0010485F5E|nr:hypothetical protein [Bosea sp. BK604]TCR66148.1 hypothetical protein EV560_10426 [Bosea sp. BK604]
MAMKTRKLIVNEDYASREDLNLFLDETKASQAGLTPDDTERPATFAPLARHDPKALNRLMARAFVDMPKSYSQKIGKLPTRRSGEPLDDAETYESPASPPPPAPKSRKRKPKAK